MSAHAESMPLAPPAPPSPSAPPKRSQREGHTELRVGEILRRARVRAGLSFEDIEQQIYIRAAHLQTIEDGQFQNLPGRIYALGFIKSYADFLGLDGDKVVSLVKRQSAKRIASAQSAPAPIQPRIDSDHTLPQSKTLLIIASLLAVSLALFAVKFGNHQKPQAITQVPADLREQVTLLTNPTHAQETTPKAAKAAISLPSEAGASLGGSASNTNAPADISANAPTQLSAQISPQVSPLASPPVEVADIETLTQAAIAQHPIVLRANENVWLEIKTSAGKTILSRVLSSGEEYWVPADQPDLMMTLGNAGGLQIILNGQNLPLLGHQGQVIRALPLTVDFLKTKLPTQR